MQKKGIAKLQAKQTVVRERESLHLSRKKIHPIWTSKAPARAGRHCWAIAAPVLPPPPLPALGQPGLQRRQCVAGARHAQPGARAVPCTVRLTSSPHLFALVAGGASEPGGRRACMRARGRRHGRSGPAAGAEQPAAGQGRRHPGHQPRFDRTLLRRACMRARGRRHSCHAHLAMACSQ